MTLGAMIIIAMRLIVPVWIFRQPVIGGIAAMVADTLDVVLIEVIGLGGFGDYYHTTDKLLDTYYLAFEMVVAFGWTNPYAKWISAALFPYRVLGVLLFELTGRRVTLFIFPNLFENWWLYCAISLSVWPAIAPRSLRTSIIALLILLVPKMGQEYLLHYAEAQPWDWTKQHILRGRI
jgi:hypothetical protein